MAPPLALAGVAAPPTAPLPAAAAPPPAPVEAPPSAERARILGRADPASLTPRLPLYFDLDVGEAEPLVLDRFAIQERLYSGALTGRERVRARGTRGTWASLDEHEVAVGLGLRGSAAAVDPKLVGWRRGSSVAAPEAIPASVRPAPALSSPSRLSEPAVDEKPLPTWVVLALIALLLGLVLTVGLLLQA